MGQAALSESLRGVEAEIAAGHPDRALVLCQDVQTRFPRALPVQRVLGEVYLALRKPREALGALDRALAGNPEDARACCARALVHQIHGDSLAALAWYRRACDISPDDQVLRSAYHEMAAHLQQPSYQPTRMGLARLYLRGDLFPHAIREWESLLADQSDSLEAQVGLAETLWRARRTHEAAERSRRILSNTPSCVKALLILAATEYDAGRADEARALLRRVAELDPDQKLAQALFADRLAAGDSAFARVMFGDEGASAQQRARSTGALSGVLDPRVAGATGGRPVSRPLTASPSTAPSPTPAVQPYPTGGPIPDGIAASAGRPSALPPDFRTIFAETEYMLWSRDDEAAPTGTIPAFERSRVDPFARSTTFVPPVLREQGSSLEDTEARAAINWIHWLQAQGARARESMAGRPGTGPLAEPFAQPRSPTVQPAPSPSGRVTQVPPPVPPIPPAASEQDWPAHQTEPLPPPSSEALRAMFAELGPEATSRRVVEGELVSAVDADTVDADVVEAETSPPLHTSDASPLQPVEATSAPEPVPAWTDTSAAPSWPPQIQLPGDEAPPDEPGADADDAGGRETQGTDVEQPVLTLESLERSFADSGFSSYELKPGELAVLSSDTEAGNGWHVTSAPQPVPSLQTASQPDTLDYEPQPDDAVASVPADETVFVAEPEPNPEPEPAADDYPGRLELARRRRGDGRLDEALNDYRTVLKNAPDLLEVVISELQESLAAAPDHPEIHRLLGDARIRQGDYLSALESYNRAVALTQAQGG